MLYLVLLGRVVHCGFSIANEPLLSDRVTIKQSHLPELMVSCVLSDMKRYRRTALTLWVGSQTEELNMSVLVNG